MNCTAETTAVYMHEYALLSLTSLRLSAFDLVATMLDFPFRLGGKIFSVAPLDAEPRKHRFNR